MNRTLLLSASLSLGCSSMLGVDLDALEPVERESPITSEAGDTSQLQADSTTDLDGGDRNDEIPQPDAPDGDDVRDGNGDSSLERTPDGALDGDSDGDGDAMAHVDCDDADSAVDQEVPDGRQGDTDGEDGGMVPCTYGTLDPKEYGYQSSLSAADADFTVWDVNQDGFDDVVACANLTATVFLGSSSGALVSQSTFETDWAVRVAFADANGDGNLDALVPSRKDITLLEVHPGDGDGTFTSAYEYTITIDGGIADGVASDISGDGVMDFVYSGFSGGYILGAKTGFGVPTPLSLDDFSYGVAVGDVDRDNRQDLVFSCWGPAVFLGGSDGFSPAIQTQSAVGERTGAPTLADVNGDGYLDVVARIEPANRIAFFWGDSTGQFRHVRTMTFEDSTSWDNSAVGDLNRDGRPDLVAISGSSYAERSLWLYINRSNHDEPLFDGVEERTLPSEYYMRVALGDINGDGIKDIVAMNSPQDTEVSLMLGTCQ